MVNTIERTYTSSLEITKHALMVIVTKIGDADFCRGFIVDLLMQHEMCSIDL